MWKQGGTVYICESASERNYLFFSDDFYDSRSRSTHSARSFLNTLATSAILDGRTKVTDDRFQVKGLVF